MVKNWTQVEASEVNAIIFFHKIDYLWKRVSVFQTPDQSEQVDDFQLLNQTYESFKR